jgi:ribose 5-phosphate isomerase B
MTIAIGSDHAGFTRKTEIADYLQQAGYTIIDVGTFSLVSVDYPDYAKAASVLVSEGKADKAIIICGSGIGVSITANKIQGIRAANCLTEEMAFLARQHNDVNVLTIGERLVDKEKAIAIVHVFLHTEFEGGRHTNRVNKIHSDTGC